MAKREKSRTEVMTASAKYAQMLLLLMIIWDVLCVVYGIGVGKSGAYISAHGARVLTLILVRCAFTSAEVIIWLLCDIAEQRQAASPAQGSAAAAPGSAAPGSAAPGSAAPGSAAPGSAAPAAQSAPESVPGTYNAQREADIYRMSQRATRTGAEAVQGFIDGKEK